MSGALRLTLPWAILCHDNHRLMPVIIKGKVRQITAPDYRKAKEALHTLLMATVKGPLIFTPVQLTGVAYFPDLRKRDAGNYRKLITDAMTGIVYADDQQVHRETWERGPIDRLNPRIELTIELLQVVAA